MTTYNNEFIARSRMKMKNECRKNAGNNNDLQVMVDGPGEGEFTIMPIKEAIENGFSYSWE